MKRIILACLLVMANFGVKAFGGTLYLAPMISLQNITTTNNNYRGLYPVISMGYSELIDFYYLAAEIFLAPVSVTMSNTHSDGGNSLRISQSFGASFMPGLFLSDGVITYLRLGVVSSKFRAPSTTKAGGQLGIGLQASLSTAWSLRGEYVYTAYSNVQNIGSPKVDAFSLGLLYKFDGLA